MAEPAHYANLSRGVLCAPADAMYCRIQSTWCEQKRWEDILWTIPVDLFVRAASGYSVIVHDQSERPRNTRAQWQGLSWVRYACRAAWVLPEEREFSRSGFDVTSMWREVWAASSARTKAYVSYYGKFVEGRVDIGACDCEKLGAKVGIPAPSRHVLLPEGSCESTDLRR